jgi:hypothetical protein
MKCPKCEYEGSEKGVKVHYARSHDGTIGGFATICAECDEEMRVDEKRQVKANSYCSDRCQDEAFSEKFTGKDNPNGSNRVKKPCKNGCGETVSRPPSQVPESGNLFCSKFCETDWREDNWDGESYRYYGANWKEQSDKARRRAGGVCEDPQCEREESQDGKELEAHHIIPSKFFDDHEEANRLDNLLVLCREHHSEVEPKRYDELDREPGRRQRSSPRAVGR